MTEGSGVANPLRDRYAIVGVGESGRSKRSGLSTLEMAVQAASAALADSGLDPATVDCIANYQQMDSVDAHTVATHLGIRPASQFNLLGGGGSTELLIAQAIGMMEQGLCSVALIFRSTNGRSGKRLGGAMSGRPGGAFTEPYGLSTPGQRFAMVATRHMWETGTTENHLADVCLTFHEHAQRNPDAMLYGTDFTLETYLSTPYISTPFRKYDFCLETDEATAIIVTSADRAKDLRKPPVYISSTAGRNSTAHSAQFYLPDITEVASGFAAEQVFGGAALSPSDVGVAAIYDCFSWVVLAQLEAYGFVGRGEAGDFVSDGNLRLNGAFPSNTAGGMSAEGYTNGMNNLIELVRQVRQDYRDTDRQAPNTEVGFVSGWNGPTSASAMIVHR